MRSVDKKHISIILIAVMMVSNIASVISFAGEFVYGDFNGSGKVDSADYEILMGAYNAVEGDADYLETVDSNSDGRINPSDYLAFMSNYGAVAPTPTPTPQPADMDLLLETIADAEDFYNYTVLEAIGNGEGQYTQECADALAQAISAAYLVYNNALATQSEVDNAVSMLSSAVAAATPNLPTATPESTGITQVIYNEDFEKYKNMTEVSENSGFSFPTGSSISLATNSTKYLQTTQNASSYIQVTFDPVAITADSSTTSLGCSAKLIAEYRIAKGIHRPGNTFWAGFCNSNVARGDEGLSAATRMETLPNSNSNSNVLFSYARMLSTGGSGPLLYSAPNDTSTVGTWVKIRYEVEFTNERGSYKTPVVQAYINDSKIPATDVGSMLSLSTNSSINAMRICGTSGASVMYVDDIKVSVQYLPAPTFDPTVPTPEGFNPLTVVGVKTQGTSLSFDIDPRYEMNEFWVGAQAVAESMGLIFYDTEDGFVIKNKITRLEAVYGQNYVTVNGERMPCNAPYREEVRAIMPVETLTAAFGAIWSWNKKTHAINISTTTIEYDPTEANSSQIQTKPYYRAITYTIPHQDPNAEVSVYRKDGVLWRPCSDPVYDSGNRCFVGSVGNMSEGNSVRLKVKIVSGGQTTEFSTTSARTGSLSGLSQSAVLYNAPYLKLVSTFENISVYRNCSDSTAIATLKYRKSGESDWKMAFTPTYDGLGAQFRGSIVGLEENTQYEVWLKLQSPSGTVICDESQIVSTWKEQINVARVINLADIYEEGKPLVLQNIKGSPDGYIKIVGDDETVVSVTDEYLEAIMLAECEYVILENVTVRGGARCGLNLCAGSRNIRVINCDFADWGRAGTFNIGKGLYLNHRGSSINNDPAIYLNDVGMVVIEHNYFHDPKGKSNSWTGPNREWENIHPEGPNGIYGRGADGVVVRYNDFVGSDEHRWNDAFETRQNFEKTGGVGYDADVYGNYFVFGQDDAIELDGKQMNVRYYENKIEGFLCGVSTAGNTVGPSYIFRNLIINLGDEMQHKGSAIKNGHNTEGISIGIIHLFHNTMVPGGTCINKTGNYYHPYSRNNILETSSETGNAINTLDLPGISEDYDLVFGRVSMPAGNGLNNVWGKASFADRLAADFRLATGSLGIDRGQIIPNFSEGYLGTAPDMGAFEFGTNNLFRVREVDIYADKYQLNLSSSQTTGTVTFNIGNVAQGTKYEILTNKVFDKWMSVSVSGGNSGTLTPNSQLSVTVRVDTTKIGRMFNGLQFARGNGAFLLKLSDGNSVPITVYAEK